MLEPRLVFSFFTIVAGLLIFGVWCHLVRREPLEYHPMYWSLVFPLGMYTVATYRLGLAADFRPLQTFSHVMVWIALVAWLATMGGLLRSIGGALLSGSAVGAGR